MTEDAKKILLTYGDGLPFGLVSVRRLLGGSKSRARRAIDDLLRSGHVRPKDTEAAVLYTLTEVGRDLAEAYRTTRDH